MVDMKKTRGQIQREQTEHSHSIRFQCGSLNMSNFVITMSAAKCHSVVLYREKPPYQPCYQVIHAMETHPINVAVGNKCKLLELRPPKL